MDLLIILSIAIPIIFLIISIILLIKLGENYPLIKTMEFYPPKGFNSAEVGFLYKGFANYKDVISLSIYLANKGYIEIIENEEKSLFKSRNFIIRKLKDYDGDNEIEEIFLEGLFEEKNQVTYKDLYNKFYIIVNEINDILNDKEKKYEIFQKNLLTKKTIVIIMMIVTFTIINAVPIIKSNQLEFLIAILAVVIVFSSITIQSNKIGANIKEDIFSALLVFGFAIGPFVIAIWQPMMQDRIYVIMYIIGILCIIGMEIVLKKFNGRTRYGNEILGEILGFKEFLEKAEKEKLEELVFQDSDYFYNMLPFAYVLEVSDKWIKKFKDISPKVQNRYFEDSLTNKNFEAFMTLVSRAMISDPNSD